MTILNNMLFWIGVILSVISAYKMYLSKRMDGFCAGELQISEKAYKSLFVIGILAALFVRIYRFGLVPGGFNQDGAMAAVDAKALADYGTDRFGMRFPVHLTAWGYGQMSALLSYLMVPFIKLFGFSTVTVRLPLLLASLGGLLCLYGFVRDVFGRKVGLIVFLFAAVNPWHILQSRWALDCNLYPHFFLAGIFLLNRTLKGRKRLGYLAASMAVFGLSMYCYGVSIYTVPLFLLAACVYLLASRRLSVLEALWSLAVYLFVAWPFIAVMAINFFGWETVETPLFTLPYFPDSVRSNDIVFFSSNVLLQLVENFKSLVRVTAMQVKDLPWNDVQNFGTMYLFSMPFAACGLWGMIHEFRKKPGVVLLLLFLATGVWCGLATNGVNVNRLNIIYYPIMILSGAGIYQVLRWISLPRLKYGMAAAYALAFFLFARTYFTGYAREMNVIFSGDFGQAVSSLRESDAEKFYIGVGNGRNVAISEILTLFWCQVDAAYFQGETLEGQLPYKEKYNYIGIRSMDIDHREDAAYVIGAEDLELFDAAFYDFQQFGAYYRVERKESP